MKPLGGLVAGEAQAGTARMRPAQTQPAAPNPRAQPPHPAAPRLGRPAQQPPLSQLPYVQGVPGRAAACCELHGSLTSRAGGAPAPLPRAKCCLVPGTANSSACLRVPLLRPLALASQSVFTGKWEQRIRRRSCQGRGGNLVYERGTLYRKLLASTVHLISGRAASSSARTCPQRPDTPGRKGSAE